MCQASGCKGGHPAQVLLSKDFPGCLLCETATKHFKLPPGSHLWNLTQKLSKSQQEPVQSSSKTQPIQSPEQHPSVLLKQPTKSESENPKQNSTGSVEQPQPGETNNSEEGM